MKLRRQCGDRGDENEVEEELEPTCVPGSAPLM